jgi:hypothetical protein
VVHNTTLRSFTMNLSFALSLALALMGTVPFPASAKESLDVALGGHKNEDNNIVAEGLHHWRFRGDTKPNHNVHVFVNRNFTTSEHALKNIDKSGMDDYLEFIPDGADEMDMVLVLIVQWIVVLVLILLSVCAHFCTGAQ